MTTASRRARLLAALGFLEIRWRGLKPDAAGALERWLHSWTGFGDVITGMQAQGFDVELRQRGDCWRVTFYPVGLALPSDAADDVLARVAGVVQVRAL